MTLFTDTQIAHVHDLFFISLRLILDIFQLLLVVKFKIQLAVDEVSIYKIIKSIFAYNDHICYGKKICTNL